MKRHPSLSYMSGAGVLFYKEGDNIGFFRVDIKGLDTLEKEYNEEETNIKKQIPKALGIAGNESMLEAQGSFTSDDGDWELPFTSFLFCTFPQP